MELKRVCPVHRGGNETDLRFRVDLSSQACCLEDFKRVVS